jgi:hypothetical protein
MKIQPRDSTKKKKIVFKDGIMLAIQKKKKNTDFKNMRYKSSR